MWKAAVEKPTLSRNPDVTEFSTEIENSFRGYILPDDSEGRKIESAPMYVSTRAWGGDVNERLPMPIGSATLYSELETDAYEEYFNHFFWDFKHECKKALVLIGDRGCGKSTLTDYYLRYYCPRNCALGHKIESKIIIRVDLKGVSSEERFNSKVKQEIEAVSRRYLSSGLVDQLITDPDTQSVVSKLLASLSDYSKKNKKYIFLCLDNLDQSPTTIHHYAAGLISDWVKGNHGIDIWKMVVPLWPETFQEMKKTDKFHLRNTHYQRIDIGKLSKEKVIGKRLNYLRSSLKKKYSNKKKGELHRVINNVINRFDKNGGKDSEYIANLVNGDIKRFSKIFSDIICSSHFRDYQNAYPKKRQFWLYELTDIILCGEFTSFNPQDSIFINVFSIGDECENESQIMLGVIALQLLAKGISQRSLIYSEMNKFGYGNGDVDFFLSVFINKGFFVYKDNNEQSLSLRTNVIDSYIRLVSNAAYIDNAAMITQLPESFANRIEETKGAKRPDFERRVRSSIVFLDYIQHCDVIFRNLWKENDYNLIGEIIRKYYFRLVHLRNSPKFLESLNISDSWWEEILGADVFSSCKNK